VSFKYVQDTYGVPAEYGRLVSMKGRTGIIIKDCGQHIGVNFDDTKPGHVSHCHPTWEMTYLGMSKPRKMTRGQKRYRDYLEVAECYENFAQYIGVRS